MDDPAKFTLVRDIEGLVDKAVDVLKVEAGFAKLEFQGKERCLQIIRHD